MSMRAAGEGDGPAMPGWEFWIDRGGTFTDVVARDPAGNVQTLKLLSEDPGRYDDAAVEGVRRMLATASLGGASSEVAALKMGTTVATNALLERRETGNREGRENAEDHDHHNQLDPGEAALARRPHLESLPRSPV